MLGRYGEGESAPQQLLDRRQIYAFGLSILTMTGGFVVQFLDPPHRPALHDAFYLVGVILLSGPILIGIEGRLSEKVAA